MSILLYYCIVSVDICCSEHLVKLLTRENIQSRTGKDLYLFGFLPFIWQQMENERKHSEREKTIPCKKGPLAESWTMDIVIMWYVLQLLDHQGAQENRGNWSLFGINKETKNSM